jgi:hypothetical protein
VPKEVAWRPFSGVFQAPRSQLRVVVQAVSARLHMHASFLRLRRELSAGLVYRERSSRSVKERSSDTLSEL